MRMTINPNTLEQFRKLNDNTLSELITHFLETVPPKLKKMVESYYLKDFPAIKKEAHLVHKSSLIIGAEILADLTLDIEMAPAQTELDAIMHEKVIMAYKEFQIIQTELNTILTQRDKTL